MIGTMKNSPKRRLHAMAAALAITVAGVGIAGCASSPPVDVGREFTPPVTEEGAQLLSAFADCTAVADMLGPALDGFAIEVDSIDETGGFCDWRAEADPGQSIGVQIGPQPTDAMPAVAAIEQAGGEIIADDALTKEGGVLYQLPADEQGVFSTAGILPEMSVWITASGDTVNPEAADRLSAAAVEILTH